MRFLGKSLALLLLMWLLAAVVQADQKGLDYPHNRATGVGCNSCHYMQGGAIPSWVTQPLNGADLDDTRYNNSCWVCHDTYIAPYMVTHSNQSDQAIAKYGKKWSIECRTCHWPHHQKQLRTYGASSYLVSGVSSEVTTYTLKGTAVEWTTDAYKDRILIPDTATTGNRFSYQYKITGNTSDTITVKYNQSNGLGAIDPLVRVPNKTFAVIYGKLIKSIIKTPNSGDKTVKFFRPTGTNSFADGVGAYDGVCEVCHTKTTHYRNDGGAGIQGFDQNHANLGGKNGSNCMECHSHSGGMKHGGGGGTGCGDATSCHGLQNSHPGHVAAGGNLAASCSTCHDTSNFPKFKNQDGSVNHTLADTDICYTCHHDGTYVATGVKVNSTIPAWQGGNIGCNGCHGNGPSYGSGSPKANSHPAHNTYTCNKCHNNVTTTGTTITTLANHINNVYNLQAGTGVSFTYAFNAGGGTCSNISCHGTTNATWGGGACLGCHGVIQGSRTAVSTQLGANSHHVQGIARLPISTAINAIGRQPATALSTMPTMAAQPLRARRSIWWFTVLGQGQLLIRWEVRLSSIQPMAAGPR